MAFSQQGVKVGAGPGGERLFAGGNGLPKATVELQGHNRGVGDATVARIGVLGLVQQRGGCSGLALLVADRAEPLEGLDVVGGEDQSVLVGGDGAVEVEGIAARLIDTLLAQAQIGVDVG